MDEPVNQYAWPRADFTRIPYGIYSDPDVYEQEQEKLFRGPVWAYLALEAEIPEPGDYRVVFVGDTEVVVNRDKTGVVHAFVNRCAHRGAAVCRKHHGNATDHVCIYHQWSYDHSGQLIGVPFMRGVAGRGGVPNTFRKADHGLRTLRVECYKGVVFGSFDHSAGPLRDYLDTPICTHLDRLMSRPLRILGYERQRVQGNWKLYADNTRDPYHGGLLHLFQVTFGIYRNTHEGGTRISAGKGHNISFSVRGTDKEDAATAHKDVGTYQEGFRLQAPEILVYRDEFGDGVGLSIMAVFPNAVFHQIGNSLAVRQIRPKGVGEFELFWTFYGYADDDADMTAHRLAQSNLAGPGGLISMEDGEAIELVHKMLASGKDRHSVVEMGGVEPIETSSILVSEIPMRGFWTQYASVMGVRPNDAVAGETP